MNLKSKGDRAESIVRKTRVMGKSERKRERDGKRVERRKTESENER